MNTEENNRIIAELLGIEQMKFHTSWDWLMPVVEEIEKFRSVKKFNIKKSFMLRQSPESEVEIICETPKGYKIIKGSDTNKLKATYKAVVEFIKWYNE